MQFNFAAGAPIGHRLARTQEHSQSFMLAPPHSHGVYGSVSYATGRDGKRFLAKRLFTKPSSEQQSAGVKVTPLDKALGEWTMAHEVPGAIKNHLIIAAPESTVQVMDLMDGDWSGVARHNLPDPHGVTLHLEAFLQSSSHLIRFHESGYVHGDVKLDNLLWSQDGRIAWGDYGVSRRLDTSTGKLKGRCGTPFAMAPEILHGRPYDEQADTWALGVALGEMFVGDADSPFRFLDGEPRTLDNLAPQDVQRFRCAVVNDDDGRLDTSKLSAGSTPMHHFFRTWYGVHPDSCRLAVEHLLVNDAWGRASMQQAYHAARTMVAERPAHAERAAALMRQLPIADSQRAATFVGIAQAWQAWEGVQAMLAARRAHAGMSKKVSI